MNPILHPLTALILAPLGSLRTAEHSNLPIVDISDETNRHVIIAQGTETDWQGHPEVEHDSFTGQ